MGEKHLQHLRPRAVANIGSKFFLLTPPCPCAEITKSLMLMEVRAIRSILGSTGVASEVLTVRGIVRRASVCPWDVVEFTPWCMCWMIINNANIQCYLLALLCKVCTCHVPACVNRGVPAWPNIDWYSRSKYPKNGMELMASPVCSTKFVSA